MAASDTFEIQWTGPSQSGFRINIASPGTAFDQFLTRTGFISPDSTRTGTVDLTAPEEPGTYEARLVFDSTIFGSYMFTVQ